MAAHVAGFGKREALLLGILLGMLAGGSGPAGAVPVTILFSGTIDHVDDLAGVQDGSVDVGTPFSGTLLFDDAAVDIDPDPTLGLYGFPSPLWTLTLTVGSYVFVRDAVGFDLSIGDRVPFGGVSDVLVAGAGSDQPGALSASFSGASFFMSFEDPDADTLASDVLADFPFELSTWPLAYAGFSVFTGLDGNDEFSASGSIEAMVVPEPASLVLLALGLAALSPGRASRRRPRG